MNYNYDDVERILNIYSTTDSFLNAEQMLNNLNNMKTPLGQEFYAALVKKKFIRYMIWDIWYMLIKAVHMVITAFVFAEKIMENILI